MCFPKPVILIISYHSRYGELLAPHCLSLWATTSCSSMKTKSRNEERVRDRNRNRQTDRNTIKLNNHLPSTSKYMCMWSMNLSFHMPFSVVFLFLYQLSKFYHQRHTINLGVSCHHTLLQHLFYICNYTQIRTHTWISCRNKIMFIIYLIKTKTRKKKIRKLTNEREMCEYKNDHKILFSLVVTYESW